MFRFLLLIGILTHSSLAFAQDRSLPAAISLEQAISRVLGQSPTLAASSSRKNVARAGVDQAGVLPNPELSVEAENIYGDGPYDGIGGAEITYGMSQVIELPGKRSSRIGMAKSDHVRARYEHDATALNLVKDVTIAYAELAAAQEEAAILDEERALAEEVRNSVAAKVAAGKEPPLQRNKAEIELSASEIALNRAGRSLSAKREVLAVLLGETGSNLAVDPSSLPSLVEPEDMEFYRSRLQQTPDYKKLQASIANAKSALSLEKANALPDPTFSLGVRQFREDNNHALVAGISVPIPVFNMNRSSIAKAGHELKAAEMDQRAETLSLDTELVKTYSELRNSYSTANSLKTVVLPGAEEAFEFARGGYGAGKFGYLDVLDAQRTLFDVRKQLNDAVLDYQRNKASIERLTAMQIHKYVVSKE